jgi:hypothetical protein
VNVVPVLNPIGNKTVVAGQLLQFTISATDLNNDLLTYSAFDLPSGANFDASTRIFTWTPTLAQVGTYTGVHFEVTDGASFISANIIVVVTESPAKTLTANAPPVMNSLSDKRVPAGQLLQFTISANDANYDVLNYSASNLPPGANFNPATRAFAWRPTEQQIGVYQNIRFEASDGSSTDSKNITVTVDATDRITPGIGSVKVSEIKPDSAIIRWITDEPSTSQVEYRASPGYLSALHKEYVTEHAVQLVGLKPGTNYRYRTLSADRIGNLSRSEEQEFTTPPAFTVSSLTVSPQQARIGEKVTISVLVTNNMDVPGSYEVTLRVGDAQESVTKADLGGGEQRLVKFITTRYTDGSSLINVNGATGTLVVGNTNGDTNQENPSAFPGALFLGVLPLIGAGIAGFIIFRKRRFAWLRHR